MDSPKYFLSLWITLIPVVAGSITLPLDLLIAAGTPETSITGVITDPKHTIQRGKQNIVSNGEVLAKYADKYTISWDEGEGSGVFMLTLNDAALSDSGEYKFEEHEDAEEKFLQVVVADLPVIGGVMAGTAGEEVEITCSITFGQSNSLSEAAHPQLTALVGETVVDHNADKSTAEESEDGATITLTENYPMLLAPEHDGQPVTCQTMATADGVALSAADTLAVKYAPQSALFLFVPEPGEGDDPIVVEPLANVTCVVESNPPANIWWEYVEGDGGEETPDENVEEEEEEEDETFDDNPGAVLVFRTDWLSTEDNPKFFTFMCIGENGIGDRVERQLMFIVSTDVAPPSTDGVTAIVVPVVIVLIVLIVAGVGTLLWCTRRQSSLKTPKFKSKKDGEKVERSISEDSNLSEKVPPSLMMNPAYSREGVNDEKIDTSPVYDTPDPRPRTPSTPCPPRQVAVAGWPDSGGQPNGVATAPLPAVNGGYAADSPRPQHNPDTMQDPPTVIYTEVDVRDPPTPRPQILPPDAATDYAQIDHARTLDRARRY